MTVGRKPRAAFVIIIKKDGDFRSMQKTVKKSPVTFWQCFALLRANARPMFLKHCCERMLAQCF